MFHKLRMQLTLINLSIIALLFLLLTSGTYFVAQNQMAKRAEITLQRLSNDINAGMMKDLPHRGGRMPVTFYIKADLSGAIIGQSSVQLLDSEHLTLLTNSVLPTSDAQGFITFDHSDYYYVKTPLLQQAGTLIMFQDFEHENNMLRNLVTALIITGLICLLLSLFGSLFMANRAMAPIQKAWQQQKDFLADASHELRTPLAVIQTNLDVVLDNSQETVASQSKWLHYIKEETHAMGKLLESLLFLARADSQQQLLNNTHFPLKQAVLSAAEPFWPVATVQGIAFQLSVEPEVTLYGDELKVRQLVGILLDNAFKHTPRDGTVSLCLLRSGNTAQLVVEDTGEGIAPEHLDKIFDRFYQADQSRTSSGTGLGLSIAKWIVDHHRGTIHVTSTVGHGTKFSVSLPLEAHHHLHHSHSADVLHTSSISHQ